MSSMTVVDTPMSKILFDEEFNCRGPIAPMDVVDLVNNIRENGLLQAVVVAPLSDEQKEKHPDKDYLLIAGYRRYTAFKVLERDVIPANIVNNTIDAVEARFFNLSENLQRKDLNIIQEAKAIASLEKFNISEDAAARKLGVSRGWIQVRYMVLRLPEVVQAEIAAGWLSHKQIRDAYSHLKESGEEACLEVVKEFKDDKLKGRKGTRKKAKKDKEKELNKKVHRKRPEIFEMQDHICDQMGNNVITRTLAWCAGEISTMEFHDVVKEHAEYLGKNYVRPE